MPAVPTSAKFQPAAVAAWRTEVANAPVQLLMRGKDIQINDTLLTDKDGKFGYNYSPFPEKASFSFHVRATGFVPYYFYGGHDMAAYTLPGAKAIRMQPGKK